MKHLIITVHGIRTFGDWQERLEKLLKDELSLESADSLEVKNYKFGWFSVITFLVPPLRWLVVRRFRKEFLKHTQSQKWDRIDMVGHSFGTHLIGWGVYGIRPEERPRVHTIILAGSVLKPGFPWVDLLGSSVNRLINDCGIHDRILILNQIIVLFTGMAGRVGFAGMTGDNFRNRFFAFGHSGYFQGREGRPDDTFMKEKWVPLILHDSRIPEFKDPRETSAVSGIVSFILNNLEPIKLAFYVSPLIALFITYLGLYIGEKNARKDAEGLVDFLQNDARTTLKKDGRLDLMEGINARIAAYYQRNAADGGAAADAHNRAQLLLEQADVYSDIGKPVDARGALEQALKLAKEAVAGNGKEDWLALVGQISLQLAQLILSQETDSSRVSALCDEASGIATRIRQTGPEGESMHIMQNLANSIRAEVALKNGDTPTAVSKLRSVTDDFKRLIDATPVSVAVGHAYLQALLRLCDIYRGAKDWPPALEVGNRAVEAAESLAKSGDYAPEHLADRVRSHATLGDVYRDAGDFIAAKEQYARAANEGRELAAKDPRNEYWSQLAVYTNGALADSLLQDGDFVGAVASYELQLRYAEQLQSLHPDDTGRLETVISVCLRLAGVITSNPKASKAFHARANEVIGRGLEAANQWLMRSPRSSKALALRNDLTALRKPH